MEIVSNGISWKMKRFLGSKPARISPFWRRWMIVPIPRLSSGTIATNRQVPREVGLWRAFHVELQGSFTTWLEWIKKRCVFVDSSSGLLELAQELTQGALADIPAETPAIVRSTLTAMASRETLFATYLRQAQSLEATTSLLGRDDVVEASLADWLESDPMTLFPRFLAVNGDVAMLSRELTKGGNCTQKQIQEFLVKEGNVETVNAYCQYYCHEVLPDDGKQAVFDFTEFVLSLAGKEVTPAMREKLAGTVNELAGNEFVTHDPVLHSRVDSFSRAIELAGTCSNLPECHVTSLLSLQQWIEEDIPIDLSPAGIDTFLAHPFPQFLQLMCRGLLRHSHATAVEHRLTELLRHVVPRLLPAVPCLLLSPLLHDGGNEALNAVSRLAASLPREFIEKTVLRSMCDDVLALSALDAKKLAMAQIRVNMVADTDRFHCYENYRIFGFSLQPSQCIASIRTPHACTCSIRIRTLRHTHQFPPSRTPRFGTLFGVASAGSRRDAGLSRGLSDETETRLL